MKDEKDLSVNEMALNNEGCLVVDIDNSGRISCSQYSSKEAAEKDAAYREGKAKIMSRDEFEKFQGEYKKLFL